MNLVLDRISKNFSGRWVLRSIQMEVSPGSIYCLLGRNGAGKSTLINIIANLIEAEEGRLTIDGKSYADAEMEIKNLLGLQSEFDILLDELNARDYLQFVGLIYRVEKTILNDQIKNLLEYFFEEESDKLTGRIKNFSSGMKKKLALCAALLHKPKLLVLDEPFANLDPVASDKLCKLLLAYINEERIIFISSHDLLYVDKIATHLGILDQGKQVFNDTIDRFRNQGRETLDANLLKYLNPRPEQTGLISHII